MSDEPTFTFPPPIVDMVVHGLSVMGCRAPRFRLSYSAAATVVRIAMETDSGWITILRGPEMERT